MVLIILTPIRCPSRRGHFAGRAIFIWYFVFAMLFNGGLIPLFLVVRSLGLLNTLGSLICRARCPSSA